MKFARFTGKELVKGTRMTIGVLGDAYVNFGVLGGAIFMFCFGLFLNLGINIMLRLTNNYPKRHSAKNQRHHKIAFFEKLMEFVFLIHAHSVT